MEYLVVDILLTNMEAKFRSPKIYQLVQGGERSSYKKGQIIQSTEGQQTMNFVTKGYIKRYLISNTGHLGVEVIYGPADFFPVTIMLENFFGLGIYEGPEVYFYEAMNDTTVHKVQVEELAKVAEKDPLLYKDLLLETGRRLHTLLNSLENIALPSPYARVAHQLAYFAENFGEPAQAGIKILAPLTCKDLADVLRLGHKEVKGFLNVLQTKELIKLNKNIIITDLERLKDEAHG
jgi:CRP-like cAMP-binding protein